MKKAWILFVILGLANIGCAETTPDKECTIGTRNCNTTTSYVQCVDGNWSSPISCDEDQQCQKGSCVPLSQCKDGFKQCVGTNAWSVCENGVWSDSIPCDTGYLCNGGICTQSSEKCKDGFKQCTSTGLLTECISGQLVTTPCPEDTKCDVDQCIPYCPQGESKCHGNKVLSCLDGETWTETKDCNTLGCNAQTNDCNDPVDTCPKGESKCSGNKVLSCQDGKTWTETKDCNTLGCNAQTNDCNEAPTPCSPSCTAGKLTYCVDNEPKQMTCPNGCDGKGCKIIGTSGSAGSTCDPQSYIESCSGNTVLYCPQATKKVAAITCPSAISTCDVIMNNGYADCFAESSKCDSVGATKQYCTDGYITNYVCSVSSKGELYWAPVSIVPCDGGNGYCTADGTCHTAQSCESNYAESCTDNLLMYCSNQYVTSLSCSDTVPCRVNQSTHDASCTETCSPGAANKISCFESNGKTLALTYSCQATTSSDYGYFLARYDECPMGCTDGKGCDAYSFSDEACPENGASCSDKWSSGCCANNSFWFCTSDETYLVLDCANDLGPSYYCDVNSSDYAFCVEKCSEEYANKFIQYGACDEDNTMELFRCELGQSGLYGSFGGRWGQSICAGSTKALSCEGVSSGSFPNTLSCTTCTSGNENGIITATCQ